MASNHGSLQKLLPSNRLENHFEDSKPALTDDQAILEANRCINCFDPPCVKACPTQINIPQFISRIATTDTLGAAKTILDANILALSCASACPTEVLCEGACVYNHLNKTPIQIGKLQRFATEYAYKKNVNFYQAGPSSGKKIALIGAGPASLACAHELRKKGHSTTIFEKENIPGGLNTYGIAPYKIKSSISLYEIEQMSAIGIEFIFGKAFGKEIFITDLLEQFDAIFFGIGLGPDTILPLKINGSSQNVDKCILGAVEWIKKMKTNLVADHANLTTNEVQTALVVGGGNTALDACRELKALGITKVIVSYRRNRNEMSGYDHEFIQARQEGVEFWFQTTPIEVELTQERRASLKVKLACTDNAVQNLELDTDLILFATGQAKLQSLLSSIPQIQFENGKLVVDPQTGQTGHPKIFAGGDLVNGGKEVVNAVAEGKLAALGIDQYLAKTNLN